MHCAMCTVVLLSTPPPPPWCVVRQVRTPLSWVGPVQGSPGHRRGSGTAQGTADLERSGNERNQPGPPGMRALPCGLALSGWGTATQVGLRMPKGTGNQTNQSGGMGLTRGKVHD